MLAYSCRLYGIHLRHWETHKVMVLFPNVMLFGPRRAPSQFARGPTLLCHVLRTLFYIPAYPHLDDIVIVEECGPLGDQSHEILVKLHALCGWKLNESKRLPQGRLCLTQKGIVLGLAVDTSPQACQDSNAVAKVKFEDCKRDKYLAQLEHHMNTPHLPSGDAAKVGGQCNYSQTHVWQRNARVLLWPIYERSRQHGIATWTPHLQWCCKGSIKLCS